MGSHQKVTNIKIPQIARWRVAGVRDTKIAQLLGMSPQGVNCIVQSQEYKEYEAAILNGHISSMDRALAGKVEAIHHEFRVLVPAAMRVLVDAVTQRRDLKTALEAAKEIFKRDPERTLPEQRSDEYIAPGIPNEVLDNAAAEGNVIAASLKDEEKKAVN